MSIIVDISNLYKTYSKNSNPALNNISLQIESGVNAVLGPNGAGKTTLIKIISGLINNYKGKVNCLDYDLPNQVNRIKPLIGIVPQDIALFQDLTAVENLNFFGNLYGVDGKVINDNIELYLNKLTLYDRRNDKIKDFSGGMKRRINLICGLLHNPKLLLLDEPVVGVDVQTKNVILKFLKDLSTENVNIIYTSHQMEDVEYLCDTVFVIDNGKLIEQGGINSLINKYNDCNNLEEVFIKLTGKALRD